MIVKCKPWKSNSQYLELAFFMTQRVPWFNLVLVAINEVRRAAWHPIALLGISWAKKGNSLWLLTTIQLYFYVKPLVQLLFFSKEKNEKLVISRKIPSSPPPSYFWPFYQTSKRCPKRAIFFYVSSSTASRYMYGMHNALKLVK